MATVIENEHRTSAFGQAWFDSRIIIELVPGALDSEIELKPDAHIHTG